MFWAEIQRTAQLVLHAHERYGLVLLKQRLQESFMENCFGNRGEFVACHLKVEKRKGLLGMLLTERSSSDSCLF